MAKAKIHWNSEKLLSISAMIISFLTLIIFVYQTNLLSRQNDISILPYLDLSSTRNQAEQIFELTLKNHGVGPAIIESVIFKHQNRSFDLAQYEDDLFVLLKAVAPELDSIRSFSSSTLERGTAIPANGEYNVIRVKGLAEEYELIVRVVNNLLESNLDYEIVYKSIQNERWRIHSTSEGPEKLRY